MDIHGNIPCSRWQIKQQIVQIAPLNFFEKTVEHLAEHWPSPDDRRIVLDKETHGDDLYTESFDGNNFFAAYLRPVFNAHHIRNTKSIYKIGRASSRERM